MQIETRYSIGETVFVSGLEMKTRSHECPDCLGLKRWKTTSPGGDEYSFACPRCRAQYMNDRELSLKYPVWEPAVRQLTIGSVRTNTESDPSTEYMCCETGVGSGTIWKEIDLHPTRDEAEQHAKTKCEERNATDERVVAAFNKTLELSDYKLSDAKIHIAKSKKFAAKMFASRVFDAVNDALDLDDAKKELERITAEYEQEQNK